MSGSLTRSPRRGGRVIECAGFEIRCTVLPYRGFESHPLRQRQTPQPGRFSFGGAVSVEALGFHHEALLGGTPLAACRRCWRDRHRARPTQSRPLLQETSTPLSRGVCVSSSGKRGAHRRIDARPQFSQPFAMLVRALCRLTVRRHSRCEFFTLRAVGRLDHTFLRPAVRSLATWM